MEINKEINCKEAKLALYNCDLNIPIKCYTVIENIGLHAVYNVFTSDIIHYIYYWYEYRNIIKPLDLK